MKHIRAFLQRLFIFAFIAAAFGINSAFAAGYTCNTKAYSSCSSGYYLSNGSCLACSNAGSSCTCSGGTAAPVCTVTCPAGQYLNGSSCATCEAGYKCAGGTWTPNGGIQGRTACSGTNEYQNETGQSTCKSVSAGYYKTSNSAVTACGSGYYCSSGVRTQCPSGWPNTASTTSSVITACYKTVTRGCTQNNGSTPGNCASVTSWNACSCAGGTYTQYVNSAGTGNGDTSGTTANETCTKTVAAVSANAGYYVSGTSCVACGGNAYYCPGGTTTRQSVSSGYYSTGGDANTRTGQSICPANSYCSGGVSTSCPNASTYARTTFPSNYYSPTITSTGLSTGTGLTSVASCRVLTWMSGTRGNLYEYATYNTSTNKYDLTIDYGFSAAKAGYYLTTKGECGSYAYYKDALVCPAGSYCPGKAAVVCNSSNQATVHTTNFGLESCPSGYPNSAAGAGAVTACFSNTKSRAWTGSQTACTKPDNCAAVSCSSCSKSACDYVAYSNSAGTGDGTIKSGCSSNSEACQQGISSVTANAGYYVSGTSCAACGGNEYWCSGGVRNSVSSGYYTTGGDANTRTGQSQCTGTTYCSGGVQHSCPTGYTANTSSGKTAASQCTMTCAAGNYMASGTYTQLQYIESTGTQYIDTGVIMNVNSKIEAKVKVPTYLGNYAVCGASNGSAYNTGEIAFFYNNSSNGTIFEPVYPSSNSSGGVAVQPTFSVGQDYTFSMNKTTITINGSSYASNWYASYQGTRSCYIFATNRGSSSWIGGDTILYYFKMYDDDVLVRDMIPVRRNSDSVLGMLDLVSGTFYTNSGSGTFTAGPDVAQIGGSCSAVGSGYYAAASTVNYGSTATRSQCPSAYPNSDSGASAITSCYSNTKSRTWSGSQTACSNPDTTGCSGYTCGTCSNPACDYVMYANSTGDGDGEQKSGCTTNNAACQQPVATLTAKTGRYTNGTTSCPACTGLPENATWTGAGTSASNCPWECDDGYGENNGLCELLCAGTMYAGECHTMCTGLTILHAGSYSYPLFADRTGVSSPVINVRAGENEICYAYMEPDTTGNETGFKVRYNNATYHAIDPR